MKKRILYVALIALMVIDTVFVLRNASLTKHDGLNLLLNGYVIGVSMLMMFDGFRMNQTAQGKTHKEARQSEK